MLLPPPGTAADSRPRAGQRQTNEERSSRSHGSRRFKLLSAALACGAAYFAAAAIDADTWSPARMNGGVRAIINPIGVK
jgi:hypothetical protein